MRLFCIDMKTMESAPSPGLPFEPAATSARRGIIVMVLSVMAFTVNTLLLRYIGEGERRISPDM